jgi:hypothetical protein
MERALVHEPSRSGLTRADSRDIAVSICNVSKRYSLRQTVAPTFQHALMQIVRGTGSSAFWVLRHVSFDVGPGESMGLMARMAPASRRCCPVLVGGRRRARS